MRQPNARGPLSGRGSNSPQGLSTLLERPIARGVSGAMAKRPARNPLCRLAFDVYGGEGAGGYNGHAVTDIE